jgi:non-heme chloroperoxidase
MSRITTADGTQLFVKDWGEGRPVVMVHGWPLTCDSFDDLAMGLVDAGMRAISYDRRGFGRSDQPNSGYDYDTLADDLASVIAHTGAKDIALLGFSMGGGEVARYMSRHDGREVRQVVLLSSILPFMLKAPDNPLGVDAKVFEDMAQGIRADRATFWNDFFRDFFGVSLLSHPVSEAVLHWARSMSMQAGLLPTLQAAQAFSHTDFRKDMASILVPTLIIHGSDDKTVPVASSGHIAAKMLVQSEYIEYDGAAHGILASHKDKVLADLLTFLQSPVALGIVHTSPLGVAV